MFRIAVNSVITEVSYNKPTDINWQDWLNLWTNHSICYFLKVWTILGSWTIVTLSSLCGVLFIAFNLNFKIKKVNKLFYKYINDCILKEKQSIIHLSKELTWPVLSFLRKSIIMKSFYTIFCYKLLWILSPYLCTIMYNFYNGLWIALNPNFCAAINLGIAPKRYVRERRGSRA